MHDGRLKAASMISLSSNEGHASDMSFPVEPAFVALARQYFDECSIQFRSTWTLYLTFYVAFLTLNGAAIGITAQYITNVPGKWIMAVTFILQNALGAGTAQRMAKYSMSTMARAQELAEFIATSDPGHGRALPPVLSQSTIPGELGYWGGMANLVGHALFAVLSLLVPFVTKSA